MTVDNSGKWWVGDSPEDVGEFLRAYSASGYPVTAFRLDADDNEGTARRVCVACAKEHFICDSGEYWDEAGPESWTCVACASRHANIGVGFALYDDDPTGVKWLYVGTRCGQCGVLGCFAGWKVGLSDALHLLDKV